MDWRSIFLRVSCLGFMNIDVFIMMTYRTAGSLLQFDGYHIALLLLNSSFAVSNFCSLSGETSASECRVSMYDGDRLNMNIF